MFIPFTFSTLKLKGDYLAIVTIGSSEIVRLILLNENWLTRGSMGLHDFDRPFEALIPFDYNYYLFRVYATKKVWK